MTTVQQVVDRVYSRLQTKLVRNVLLTTVNTSITTYAFTYDLGRIAAGAKVSIGLEDAGVFATAKTAKTATVRRGDFGSTAATHTAGDVALVDAVYTPFEIVTTINTGLFALSGMGLPKFTPLELTARADKTGYDLTGVTGKATVHKVQVRDHGSDDHWTTIPRSLWRHEPGQETDQFPSGHALFVYDDLPAGRQLRVTYKGPYAAIAALNDNVESVSGLPAQFHDILTVDACWRLLGGRIADRTSTDSQGSSRRAEEVTPVDQIRATQPFYAERQELLSAARSWQIAEYGL